MMFSTIKRKKLQAAVTAIMAISLAACATGPTTKPVSIDTAVAAKADFSGLQTFYVLDVPPGENEVAPEKPFSRVVVEEAVRNELMARNYREVSNKDAADMLVAIQFSLKDETQYKEKTTYETQPTSYSSYGNSYYGRGYGTGYGYGYGRHGYGRKGYGRSSYGGAYGSRYSGYSYGYGYRNYYGYTTIPRTTIVAEDFRQGNMLIDLIDRKTNAVVWEAHASGEGEHEPSKIEARVNMVVSRIFSEYPHSQDTL